MTSAIETPREAARRLAASAIRESFKPEALHEYRATDGKAIYWRIRARRDDGEKWIRPMMLNGHGYELREPDFPAGKKPLYNLDLIAAASSATVWIVEGEKAADALTKLGATATTSGSAKSATDADWSSLAGRDCCIWPDNDEPGKAYAGDVGNVLAGLGCKLACVDVARLDLPPKGDAVEWLQSRQYATLGDLQALPLLAYQPPAQNAPAADLASVVLRRVSDVEAVPIRWLWPGRIARGKLTMIAGHPGLGKSQLTCAIAAVVTTGGRWPVDGTLCELGSVAMLSAEDDVADTIRPRLEAAGADVSRVEIVDGVTDGFDPSGEPIRRSVSLKADVAKLDVLFTSRRDIAVLIVDPVSAYLGGTDSHVNADVRALLAPLSALAAKHQIAVIMVSHLNKGGAGTEALSRVTGSLAFVAAARGAFIVAKDQDDQGRRLFVPAKNNIARDVGGLAFTVESFTLTGGIETSRILWEAQPVTITADEVMASQPDGGERTMTEDAVDLLRDMLIGGRVLARDVKRRASESGISDKALRSARLKLGIAVSREGFGADTRSYWSLHSCPTDPFVPNPAHGQNRAEVGTQGTNGATIAATEEFF